MPNIRSRSTGSASCRGGCSSGWGHRRSHGTPASYAHGWWIQQWRGQKLVWHAGRWPDAYAGLLLKVPGRRLTLVALANTDGLAWPTRLQVAEVEKNPLALKFLELFAGD